MQKSRNENVEHVAHALIQCVRTHFQDNFSNRIEVEVDQAGNGASERGQLTSLLHFRLPDGTEWQGTLGVSNFGGNVYDVNLRIADGKEQVFEVTVPEAERAEEVLQLHTDAFCEHVLSELARAEGMHHLQQIIKRKGNER